MAAVRDGALGVSQVIGAVGSIPMTGLGVANVVNGQVHALSGQGGGGYSSFGMDGGGGSFGASAGPGGAGFGMGGGGMGGMGGVGDLTGTSFGIQSQGGDYRQQARRLEGQLRMLIAMIMAGNTDAITTAMTVLSAQSKKTLIHASLHVIQAMRQYNNQMSQLSDQMGGVNMQAGQGQSQLAGLNSQFQMLSTDRQQAMNMLKDVMTGVEEIESANKSIQDTMLRSKARYAQWT